MPSKHCFIEMSIRTAVAVRRVCTTWLQYDCRSMQFQVMCKKVAGSVPHRGQDEAPGVNRALCCGVTYVQCKYCNWISLNLALLVASATYANDLFHTRSVSGVGKSSSHFPLMTDRSATRSSFIAMYMREIRPLQEPGSRRYVTPAALPEMWSISP